MSSPKPVIGRVTLLAAGPGEVDLLPVRAVAALSAADLVVADPAAIRITRELGLAAEVVASGPDGLPLERAALLKAVATAAKAGRAVVRLFAGDPLLDGHFARESAALHKAGLEFDFVPALSSVTAAAAYAGIGLAGQSAHEVRILDAASKIDWSLHATANATLVLMNGLEQIAVLVKEMLAAGFSPTTAVLVNRAAGTSAQRSLVSQLQSVVAEVKASGHIGDGVLVIGDTAVRPSELSWFEARPLFGWRVLLPLTKDTMPGLRESLISAGALVTEVPTLSVEPPRSPAQMEKAVTGLVAGRYEWVVFTCVNAVQAVFAKCEEFGLDSRVFSGLKIAAAGNGTAAALKVFGLRADISIADDVPTNELLEVFPEYDELVDPFNRLLLPRADIATESLLAGLSDLGWEVEDVTAYRTVRALPPSSEIREAIKAGEFDAVVFSSASTVRNLVGIAGKPHPNSLIACIGPKTAKACEEHGLQPAVIATEPSATALAQALTSHASALRDEALEAGNSTWRPSLRRANGRRKAN